MRVMTVHGSKGLQAPIVILADATDDPVQRQRGFDLSLEGWDRLPVFGLPKEERHGPVAAAHDRKAQAEIEEHWRLLYVAMTRAEELLIVAGVTRKEDRSLPELCWHAAVGGVMEDMGLGWQDAGPRWGQKRVHAANAKVWARQRKKPATVTPAVAIPEWATKPAPEEARPPRPLAPSALGEDDVASPPQGRRARGRCNTRFAAPRAVRAIAPGRVRASARCRPALAVGTGGGARRGARAAMVDEVLGVLEDPAHAALFGPVRWVKCRCRRWSTVSSLRGSSTGCW